MSRTGRFIFVLACLLGIGPRSALRAAEAEAGAKPALVGPQYWSYRSIQNPAVPTVHDSNWPKGDIDRFILAGLEARGIKPVTDASPAVLVRRLYFDLTGMPPTPEEIDAFLKDASPTRYERLVNQLLDSPRFGQRRGRHWLDVARYGESLTLRGFLLKDAWRYRDYVIDSFNQDRPFDQFIREQICGDLMPADSVEDRRRKLIATEYLVLGNVNLEEQDKKQLEMDVVDEQINAIGAGVLAQTIGCARCHNHKFDPIATRDYYALAGILHSTVVLEHANVSKHVAIALPVDPARESILKAHETAIAELQEKIAQARLALAKSNPKGIAGKVVAIADLPGIVVDDVHAKRVGTWKQSTSVKSYIGEGYLSDDNGRVEAKTLTFSPENLEAGKYEVRFAYTSGSNRATNVSVTVFSADGDQKTLVNERMPPPVDGHFISLGHHNFEKGGQAYVLVSNDEADGRVTADAVQFLPVDSTPVAGAGSTAAPKTPSAAKSDDPGVKKLEADLKKLIADGPTRDTIDGVRESKQIGDTRINIRGNVHSLGDVAPRGFLHVISVDHSTAIGPKESGRRELGDWLADPQNPLPARVMANRTWHWLFGAGIVRTVDNFGTTGELPSNPQLLDYLATKFVAEKWSVKSLVRQIVLSHAYQLSSDDDAADIAVDPENRLVWRANRRRLDAECIRDAMLAISGQLSKEAGGPTYKPGLAADFGYQQTARCASVYLPAFRNAEPELFDAFDCADPSVSTGRRNVSTVAPQALFMLNSAFVTEQSRHAAADLLANKTCNDDAARVIRAYRLTLSREPTERERQLMLDFVKESGGSRWEMVFHGLFASIDFRYVD